MASIDLTRSAFQPAKRFTSVQLQQGRVILDDDWNESESITVHERVESLVDVIGPSGTSDDALAVSNVVDSGGEVDFDLGEGTFYVGGRRLRWPSGRSYRFQDDFFGPPVVTAPAGDRHDLVWLEAMEVPITAVEDAELREVGLGGPDTTGRTRLVARVHVEEGTAADCEEAWESTVGADVDARGTLTTDARMTVDFVADTTPVDLCTPAAAGGYLTHLNQAIRVQCTDASRFAWGFDNVSSTYRVDLLPDRQTIHFRDTPPDDAHRPRAGQVVELLPWSSVLSNGQRQATDSGLLAVVGDPFDPDSDELRLTAAVGDFGELDWLGRPDEAELEADGRYVFLRVWERGDDTSGPELAFTAGGAAVPLGTTGLQVSFTGSTFRRGDHWIIAARPAEPLQVVPWVLATGAPPHGPVRLRAPLGIIHWTAGVPTVHDCRRRFRPLTELQGCCGVTVGDGSHSFGDTESIQAAIDMLPPEGGRVCVLAGHYAEGFEIVGRSDIEVHGCGADTVIEPPGDDVAIGAVIAIDASQRITIRSMSIIADGSAGVVVGVRDACTDVTLSDLVISADPLAPGVLHISPVPMEQPGERFALLDSTIEVRSLDAPPEENVAIELWPAVVVQGLDLEVSDCTVRADTSLLTGALGGIQVCGLSRDVMLARNTIEGGNGHGITLGSLVWIPARDSGIDVFDVDAYVASMVFVGWLVWFDGGCIHLGDPPGDDDGDDDDEHLVPRSAGPVLNLAIEDNLITDMAGDGIGVVRFFDPTDDEEADIVELAQVRIDRNHVMGNRRTAPLLRSPVGTRLSGAGGVALGEVEDLRLHDNRIVGNGRSELVPMCGVFVLSGAALLFTGNDIVDNGADTTREGAARIGNRGGVVVRSCRAISVGKSAKQLQAPEVAAVFIHGNRISQPAGQAVWVMGVGAMSIHDNQLAAGNLATVDIFAAALRMLEGRFDELRDVVALLLAHFAGLAVTVINLGLPVDVFARLGQDGGTGDPTPGLGKYLGSAAVIDSDDGKAAYEESVTNETKVARPVAGIDDRATGAATRLLAGGHVSFDDNQVTLDLVDDAIALALCSVLLLSIDDIAMHDNQARCLTLGDLVLVDAIAMSLWTVRCQGNRFQEMGRLGGDRALGTLASLLSFASMNTTTANQMTNRYFAGAFTAPLLVDEQNLVWP